MTQPGRPVFSEKVGLQIEAGSLPDGGPGSIGVQAESSTSKREARVRSKLQEATTLISGDCADLGRREGKESYRVALVQVQVEFDEAPGLEPEISVQESEVVFFEVNRHLG